MSRIDDLPHAQIVADDEDSSRVYSLTKDDLERIVIDTIRYTTGIGPALEQQLLQAVRKELALALKRVIAPNNREFVVHGIQHSESTNLELKFLNKLSQPVLTGKNIKGEEGSSCLKIALVEVGTEKIIDFGPEASATVEIVVIPVHPDNAESILPACKSFLTGSRLINLKEGIGSLDDFYFPHKRSWRKRCQLMLGANVVGNFDRVTIKGAKSEPFILRDSRLPLYEKHHPPSLSDKVWRLNNISKGGTLQKRLSGNNIETVEDFLKEYHLNPQQLREILGPSMSSKKLNDTVRHGLECRLEDRFLYCLPDSQQQPSVVLFNRVGQVLGLQYDHGFRRVQDLCETEKGIAQNLVVSAFAHWENVIPQGVNEANNHTAVFDHSCASTFSQGINSSSVFDHTQPGTSSQCINSSAVFDHTRPSTSSQCINSYADWTTKCHTAMFDHAQASASFQGINASAGVSNHTFSSVYDHLGLVYSEDTELESLYEHLGDQEVIQGDNLDACFHGIGKYEPINQTQSSPRFAFDFLDVPGWKPDSAYNAIDREVHCPVRSLPTERIFTVDGCELFHDDEP